ncbi:cation:proton antiporter [Candidatus Woesearchaeota archaeon]|nr:cation:proton antiporter [Candidatus Woesearchaeota archaeon]
MVDVTLVLLGISFILMFGFFAEFVFKKLGIPDILFLLMLGFVLGPHVLGYVPLAEIEKMAPVFTTFTLLFLMYDGAFNIDLASFAKGVGKGIKITFFNFFISSIVVFLVMLLFRFSLEISLLTGFIIGGLSSAFVIPLLKQMNVGGETYFILTFESALTDVLCIVFALTMMGIITLNSFSFKLVTAKLISLFAVAGFVGILAGILWIIIVRNLLKEHKAYMITIAYVILTYVVTEFLNGNGAIAVLFLGLVLKNSRHLMQIVHGIVKNEKHTEKKNAYNGITITSPIEEMFYSQISFFLKTFFFVYIGVLFNIADRKALLIGGIITVLLMFSRTLSKSITKKFNMFDRKLMSSIFARGLAAAAIAQILVGSKIPQAFTIANIVHAVIIMSIFLSSLKIYLLKSNSRLSDMF